MEGSTTTIVLKELEGNAPTHYYGAQAAMLAHLDVLVGIWWCLFIGTLIAASAVLVREYGKRMRD